MEHAVNAGQRLGEDDLPRGKSWLLKAPSLAFYATIMWQVVLIAFLVGSQLATTILSALPDVVLEWARSDRKFMMLLQLIYFGTVLPLPVVLTEFLILRPYDAMREASG